MDPGKIRKIIHVDMDAFFASIEQRDRPELRNKPVVVGGDGRRGVVAAASYEARKYGVRSAMPSSVAKQKCSFLIFVRPRFEQYQKVSMQIREIFHAYTELVEPLSLDEAYLDVTENKKGLTSATLIAKEIKRQIKEKTGLTASAGVSVNKFLAKIASDFRKPDGLFVITPEEAESFVEDLPIEKFHGIGKVTAKKMHESGIFYGKDLKSKSRSFLTVHFGKVGHYYYQIARGHDDRLVNPNRIRKSIGAEKTFVEDLNDKADIMKELDLICREVWERLSESSTYGKTVTIKIRFRDFTTLTRSKTTGLPLLHAERLLAQARELFNSVEDPGSIRLLGVTVSNLHHEKQPVQLTLDF